jgi:uncharacterized protein (DUF1800 family)
MAATLPPLDQVDPALAWQPWVPTPADPWGRRWAAHLYRRAAFGASGDDLLEAERLGPQGTLDLLLRGRPQAEEVLPTLLDAGRVAAGHDDNGELLAGWWLYCMLHGGHPLREKMTLFWHNHFATSIAKVLDSDLMFRQNGLLREHALGKFGAFLQAINKDGAMLVWLDSNRNVKGRPNENYARELMELFSLGIGNYTEKDVREAARAFTGWHTTCGSFCFHAGLHDTGAKTVLGQTGDWNGDDVVRIVLGQPAAARFLVRKLYTFLISETAPPPNALLEPLCESFRKSDYDIAGLVRTMLASQLFYSGNAFRQRIKSPVEYVLGAVQAVYRRYPEGKADYRALPHQRLVGWMAAMSQQLFAPPNVKGWPGGRSWLNTATVLERDNFAASVALGTLWGGALPEPTAATDGRAAEAPEAPPPPPALDPARLRHEEKAISPEDIVRVLLDLYLPGGVRPEARARLVAFLAEGHPGEETLDRRVREAVGALLTLTEYQLA